MNQNIAVDKHFPPLERYGERFLISKSRNNIEKRVLASNIEAFFKFVQQFPIESRTNECRKLLESFKRSELRNLGIQAQKFSECNDSNQRSYDIIIDLIYTKVHTTGKIVHKRLQSILFPYTLIIKD